MKVLVRHGHFAFYPHARDEVIRFQRLFRMELVAEDDYFTFPALEGLPRWSQVGRLFSDELPAVVTFEGRHAWEVMRENGFVYSLALGAVVPYVAVADAVKLPQTLDCALAPKPLIQPGAVLLSDLIPGNIILGYEGDLDLRLQKLYVYARETLL